MTCIINDFGQKTSLFIKMLCKFGGSHDKVPPTANTKLMPGSNKSNGDIYHKIDEICEKNPLL